jgi:hypothetical protein
LLTGFRDVFLLKVKEEVEKNLEDHRWQRVSERLKVVTGQDAKPSELRRRWNALKESKWMVQHDRHDDGKSKATSNTLTEESENMTAMSSSGSGRQTSRFSAGQVSAQGKEEDRHLKRGPSEELRPGDRSRKASTPPAATHIPSKKRRDFQGLTELLDGEI